MVRVGCWQLGMLHSQRWIHIMKYHTLRQKEVRKRFIQIYFIFGSFEFLGNKVTTPADSSCVEEEITYWLDTPFIPLPFSYSNWHSESLFKCVNKQSDLTFDSHKSPFPCLLTHTNVMVFCSPHSTRDFCLKGIATNQLKWLWVWQFSNCGPVVYCLLRISIVYL